MVAHSKAITTGVQSKVTKSNGKVQCPKSYVQTKAKKSQKVTYVFPSDDKENNENNENNENKKNENLWESLLDDDIVTEIRRLWEKHGKVRDLSMADMFAGWAGIAKARGLKE